jgi:hypothetical protein
LNRLKASKTEDAELDADTKIKGVITIPSPKYLKI